MYHRYTHRSTPLSLYPYTIVVLVFVLHAELSTLTSSRCSHSPPVSVDNFHTQTQVIKANVYITLGIPLSLCKFEYQSSVELYSYRPITPATFFWRNISGVLKGYILYVASFSRVPQPLSTLFLYAIGPTFIYKYSYIHKCILHFLVMLLLLQSLISPCYSYCNQFKPCLAFL